MQYDIFYLIVLTVYMYLYYRISLSVKFGTQAPDKYRIAGFFRGRKLSRILRFCGDSRKFYPRKSIVKQLDTVLVGVVHWVTANSQTISPRKSIFKQFAKVFSLERNPLYVFDFPSSCKSTIRS